jgi:hypothetical protein
VVFIAKGGGGGRDPAFLSEKHSARKSVGPPNVFEELIKNEEEIEIG